MLIIMDIIIAIFPQLYVCPSNHLRKLQTLFIVRYSPTILQWWVYAQRWKYRGRTHNEPFSISWTECTMNLSQYRGRTCTTNLSQYRGRTHNETDAQRTFLNILDECTMNFSQYPGRMNNELFSISWTDAQ